MSTINDMVSLNTGLQQVQNNVLQKLSSGNEVNKAADDASGLAIADNLRTQSSALYQSIDNANSGIAMSNIADQAISSQKDILGEIKTLTIQANTATTSTEGREAIAEQINKYLDEYEGIAERTNYNGTQLLTVKGDATDDLSIAGADGDVRIEKADTLSVSDELRSLMSDFVMNPDSRSEMLDAVDEGMNNLASFASEFGSATNQLESRVRNEMTNATNTQAARSTIIEADIAKTISDFNKTNIQSQAGYFAQSQANAVQSRVTALLS
jgi:flagellin